VGDGPQRAKYEKWAIAHSLAEIVHFWGWQPRPELAKFYASAHFLLLPTYASEGWPKVLSEGMASGVVPVAGIVSSIPQILGSLGCGVALPLVDEAFTEAILLYINKPQYWSDHRDAAVAGAVYFSYQHILMQYKRFRKCL
jgi:glycosyltransferase involved in cell wall biosynthesis